MTLGELRRTLSEGLNADNAEVREILRIVGINQLDALLYPEREVSSETEKRASELADKRRSGYPLQYLAGEWEFYGLPFRVGEGVLIPRQDTETIVELGIDFLKRGGGRVCDLCAGSGCIGITLAKHSKVKVTCAELSESAFAYLEENIALNGVGELVTAVRADVLGDDTPDMLEGSFDLIVSNPPYLSDSDMNSLQREVTFEPEAALYGGRDGLDFYERLLELYLKKLNKGGMIAFEIGIDQDAAVAEFFKRHGIEPKFKNDLAGIKRVIYGNVQ